MPPRGERRARARASERARANAASSAELSSDPASGAPSVKAGGGLSLKRGSRPPPAVHSGAASRAAAVDWCRRTAPSRALSSSSASASSRTPRFSARFSIWEGTWMNLPILGRAWPSAACSSPPRAITSERFAILASRIACCRASTSCFSISCAASSSASCFSISCATVSRGGVLTRRGSGARRAVIPPCRETRRFWICMSNPMCSALTPVGPKSRCCTRFVGRAAMSFCWLSFSSRPREGRLAARGGELEGGRGSPARRSSAVASCFVGSCVIGSGSVASSAAASSVAVVSGTVPSSSVSVSCALLMASALRSRRSALERDCRDRRDRRVRRGSASTSSPVAAQP